MESYTSLGLRKIGLNNEFGLIDILWDCCDSVAGEPGEQLKNDEGKSKGLYRYRIRCEHPHFPRCFRFHLPIMV